MHTKISLILDFIDTNMIGEKVQLKYNGYIVVRETFAAQRCFWSKHLGKANNTRQYIIFGGNFRSCLKYYFYVLFR